MITVRAGIPASFQRFTEAAASIGAPILVSANALRRRGGGFRTPTYALFNGCDAALDSAGFVAMVKYRGYPWSVDEYVGLAASYPWAWWASMDFCCEPQVAGDREAVLERVRRTADMLPVVREAAERHGAPPPMPVLQGWQVSDYLRCAEWSGDLPDLVGLGSVCRRQVKGPDGLLAIVDALDQRLATNVRLHLFGVKGPGVHALRGHPRVASIDSMAWDFACRRERQDQPYSVDVRSQWLKRWWLAHQEGVAAPGWGMQMDMLAGAA
jgi:hypothetical protein